MSKRNLSKGEKGPTEEITLKNHKTDDEVVKRSKVDDKLLERMAIEEIQREIAIKSVRANEIGPSGWLDYPIRKTNKRFLRQTIRSVISHNDRTTNREKFRSEEKLLELSGKLKTKKFGERKFLFKAPIKRTEETD